MKKSIKQKAVDFAGDRSKGAGHGYPSWEAKLIERGYIKGAKDQENLMYSEEEVIEILNEYGYAVVNEDKINSIGTVEKWFEQFKKSKTWS
jgi:hypothetical protein